VQRRIKKIARAVTREHPPRAIRSVSCRRKSQNQELRVSVSESRHRSSPVRPHTIRAALFTRHFLAVAHQPRTLPASHNFFIHDAKQERFFRHELTRSGAP